MKNLKKLLIAVALLALLVTGVVISVFAAPSDDAVFNRAKMFYSFVEEERSAQSKADELAHLYEFVESYALSESVEGFAEFKASYQKTSVKIAYSLYEEAMQVSHTLNRLNALYQVSLHFNTCPVEDSTEGYAELNTLISTETDRLLKLLYDEAVSVEESMDGGAARREALLKVFAQVARIPLLEDEWDYYYFSVEYNTSGIEAAMSLAELAAGMFAKAEDEAREQYKEDLITAIAAMYAASARDHYIFETVSEALVKKEDAYQKKLQEETEGGADENAAIEAATAAGEAAYKEAIAEVKAAAEKAYNDAIAANATEEEAALAYERAVYAKAYEAYDSAYAEGIANLEADAKAAYDAAYEAKLTEIYNEMYMQKYQAAMDALLEGAEKEAYDAKYAEALAAALESIDLEAIRQEAYNAKYDEVYEAQMQPEDADAEAAKAAAEAAAKIAADEAEAAAIAKKETEARNAAVEEVARAAAEAAKNAEESKTAATEAAEAKKTKKIDDIKKEAEAAADEALAAIKAPIDDAASEIYSDKLSENVESFTETIKSKYDAVYAKAYAEALLDIEGDAKAAYNEAYNAAKSADAEEADAVKAGFDAYWAAVEEEAKAAYAPVYKENFENALAILVTCADEKYRLAYNTAYDEAIALDSVNVSGAVAQAKAAGDAAYKSAVDSFKAELKAANDEAAYNKVIDDALKAITDSHYNDILSTLLIEVEYEFTLPARNAYNDEYQNVYEKNYFEYEKTLSRAEASTKASADAKVAAELAYELKLKELIVNVIEKIPGFEADADTARTAAYNAAVEAGKSEDEAVAAGEDAYRAFYVAKLSVYYQAAAEERAEARCEEIKTEIRSKAAKTAEAESAGAYNDVIGKYESAAEEAGASAGDKAYNEAFDEIVKEYCDTYSVAVEDAEAELEKVIYNDPIKDSDLKGKYSEAVKNFEDFYAKCEIDEKFGSLAASFDKLDAVLKGVALTDAMFIFVKYDEIPNEANKDYPYPLNLKNSVICMVQNVIDAKGLDYTVEGFVDFYNRFSAAKTEYERLLENAKNKLDRLADLDQYGWTSAAGYYEYVNDFSSGTILSTANAVGTTKGELGDDNGNYYMILNYGDVKSHLYTEPSFSGKFENGLVLNFDMKFSETFYTLQFRVLSRTGATLYTDPLNFTLVDGKIALYYQDLNNERVYVKNIFEPEVWNHFTLTYDHASHTGSIYVNYEYIGDVSYYDLTNKQVVDFQHLRINAQATNQAVSLDNLHFFAGTTYRDYYKFQNMSDGQTFKYCVDLFTDPDLNPANRNGAYVKAKGLYESFVNDPTYDDYTKYFTDSKYANYYVEYIKEPAIETNMKKIAEMFEQLPERNSGTIETVRAMINNIDKFVTNNTEFLDRTSAEYIEQMAQLTVIETELLRAEYVRDFVESLRFFDRATTLASMTKHYNNAKNIYILAGYAKTNADGVLLNIEYIKDDPAVEAFAAYLNPEGEGESEGTEAVPAVDVLFDYYHETAPDKMDVREAFENSRRIVDCLYFILDMKIEVVDEEGNVTVQGYEDTEEFWAANYEYINTYITIIRNVVSSDLYDKTYTESVTVDGEVVEQPISYFIEKYEPINAYFYELLQEEHLALLSLQLETFASVDSYIQKVGICNYIKNYVEDNDIDVTRPEFAEIIHKVSVYENELAFQEADYALILKQNTQYFITAVNKMTAYVNYEDIVPLFEEATEYYYVMNVDSEEAKTAIEIYTAYAEKLEGIQENSILFIGYADAIESALKYSGERREKTLYAALVNAMDCVDGVDMTYEGVKDAYITYAEQLAAYNSGAEDINSDISGIADVTCAVRTNTVSSIVLAIIKTIFSN